MNFCVLVFLWKLKKCKHGQQNCLVDECIGIPYSGRLKYLNLPTLHFRRCRGDMIETFKTIRKIYDEEALPNLTLSTIERTRFHQYKLFNKSVRCDVRKYYFTERKL